MNPAALLCVPVDLSGRGSFKDSISSVSGGGGGDGGGEGGSGAGSGVGGGPCFGVSGSERYRSSFFASFINSLSDPLSDSEVPDSPDDSMFAENDGLDRPCLSKRSFGSCSFSFPG